jgi:acyl-CoA hydrolase
VCHDPSDKIDFTKPIPAGTIVELVGSVARIGNSSIDIKVEIFIEQMYSDHREKAIWKFHFVALLDENKNPTKILDNKD